MLGKAIFPDFVIIGAQKCASTSLLSYMGQHSQIRLPRRKSTHYFDLKPEKSASWYKRQFPRAPLSWGRSTPRRWLTGESCPAYMFLPQVPEHMAALMPHVKLIAILRDPVKRLISQYQHEARKGRVAGSFEDYVAQSIDMEWPATGDLKFQLQQAAVPRGFYADQLAHWQKFFPAEQMLVVSFEDLISKPDDVMNSIFAFLGLPEEKIDTGEVLNRGIKKPDQNYDANLLNELNALYEQRNAQL